MPIFVAKGTMVAFRITALYRRKWFWGEDANTFRPERWAESNGESKMLKPSNDDGTISSRVSKKQETGKWTFIPFNGGLRHCIGQELATIEIAYLLIRLVQFFRRVDRRDEEEWIEGLAMAWTSKNGAKVAMVPEQY